jgi:hypothetical protein
MTDLLTCPFCGSDDLNVYRGHPGDCVQCRGCKSSGVLVKTWNMRAPRHQPPQRSGVCPNCGTGYCE